MRIGKDNRFFHEHGDVVARDGFEIDGDMGEFSLGSLWVKGDITIGKGTHVSVIGEIVHCAGVIRAPDGIEGDPIYHGITLLDHIWALDKVNEELEKAGCSVRIKGLHIY